MYGMGYKYNIGQTVVIDTLCEFVGMTGKVLDRARELTITIDENERYESISGQYLVSVNGHEDWYSEVDLTRHI